MRVRPRPLLERIPLSGLASVAVRKFRYTAFRYPWHQHPEIELTWILSGSGLRYVGDSVEPFRPGDFCLLGESLPHTWLSPKGEPGPVRSMVVQFDPTRWGTALLVLPEFARIADLLERASRGLWFDSVMAQRTLDIMLSRASPLGHFISLLEILQELASDSKARPLTTTLGARNRRMDSDPRVRTLWAFLSENSVHPLTQKEAARQVRLSPAAFSRFFRRAMGKTFSAYVTDLRLGDACRQLLESNHSISQIAFDVGFGNLSTFNRSFRKARGVSPSVFRTQALGIL